MAKKIDHICIGICTYKRPQLLDRVLNSLENQVLDGTITHSIIVIDNDKEESAKNVVTYHQKNTLIPIHYLVEPEQNISLARNKALKNTAGDFFAGIDDDELANNKWLANLYLALKKYHADGVLGPVLPSFEVSPPRWVIKGSYFLRESFPTGTILTDPRHMRSGNFLLDKKVVQENDLPFDPRFGRTGGEDVDFFKRMIARHFIFIWCNEAIVHEIIPPKRLHRSYLIKRALLRGVANASKAPLISIDSAKSLIAILLYALITPYFFLFQHNTYLEYIIKICDHAGKILARFGISLVKERSI